MTTEKDEERAKRFLAVVDRVAGPVETEGMGRAQFLARLEALEAALAPLVAIADAYDENELDDEARKRWGKDLEHENRTPPEDVELFSGRGGAQLLTLADCLRAREAVKQVASATYGKRGEQARVVPAVLHCPHCKKQHVDEGKWATKPHRTHACVDDVAGKGCGKPFTPSAYRTVGVLAKDLVFEALPEEDGRGKER